MEKYYISTAIAYTSGKPHIGNTYEIVLADAIARFKRLKGYDVYFQTGTDEHGEKIEQKAREAGVTPQEFVDEKAAEIKRIWDIMNTSYDKFVRTTDKNHERVVQDIFNKMYEKGDIYKGEYKGLYCTPCESFWTESQLVDGKCPDCGREVNEVHLEAGSVLTGEFVRQGLVDELLCYIAPKILGEGRSAFHLKAPESLSEVKDWAIVESSQLGNDIRMILRKRK